MREDWTSTDTLTYTDFNVILSKIQALSTQFNYRKIFTNFALGGILFIETLNDIEEILGDVCMALNIDYERRIWSNLSAISCVDINRWCKAINMIESETYEVKTYNDLNYSTYNDMIGKYAELLV